jgi:hypothetical protein
MINETAFHADIMIWSWTRISVCVQYLSDIEILSSPSLSYFITNYDFQGDLIQAQISSSFIVSLLGTWTRLEWSINVLLVDSTALSIRCIEHIRQWSISIPNRIAEHNSTCFLLILFSAHLRNTVHVSTNEEGNNLNFAYRNGINYLVQLRVRYLVETHVGCSNNFKKYVLGRAYGNYFP